MDQAFRKAVLLDVNPLITHRLSKKMCNIFSFAAEPEI